MAPSSFREFYHPAILFPKWQKPVYNWATIVQILALKTICVNAESLYIELTCKCPKN